MFSVIIAVARTQPEVDDLERMELSYLLGQVGCSSHEDVLKLKIVLKVSRHVDELVLLEELHSDLNSRLEREWLI